jgi:hypothetical protein
VENSCKIATQCGQYCKFEVEFKQIIVIPGHAN